MQSNEKDFWQSKWQNGQTRWDMGGVHPLTSKLWSQAAPYASKSLGRVVIPGCGRGHDATFFKNLGFEKVTLVDIVPEAIESARELYQDLPGVEFVCGDILSLEGLDADVIFDRAMLCAVAPDLRKPYLKKCYDLLKNGGIFISIPFLEVTKPNPPPFQISKQELELLSAGFVWKYFEELPEIEDDVIKKNGFLVLEK